MTSQLGDGGSCVLGVGAGGTPARPFVCVEHGTAAVVGRAAPGTSGRCASSAGAPPGHVFWRCSSDHRGPIKGDTTMRDRSMNESGHYVCCGGYAEHWAWCTDMAAVEEAAARQDAKYRLRAQIIEQATGDAA